MFKPLVQKTAEMRANMGHIGSLPKNINKNPLHTAITNRRKKIANSNLMKDDALKPIGDINNPDIGARDFSE